MAIELQRGVVTSLNTSEQGNKAECLVGDQRVLLHGDLLSNVSEGEEVAVAGNRENDEIIALAVNNITHHRGTQIDGSNTILALGLAGFIWIVFFVLAMQHLTAGNANIGGAYGAASFIGLIGIGVVIQKLLLVRRAARLVRYLDD